jgi:hypothetical protein
MTEHYTNIGERKTDKRWVSVLIRKLWETAWDLWQHCNGILHNKINGYANQSLTAKISKLWKHPALQSIASIKYLVKEGEDSVQGKTQQQKQLWAVLIEAAIQRYTDMREATAYHQEREGRR